MPKHTLHTKQKGKNIALALMLVGLMVVLYALTLIRVGGAAA